MSLAGDYAPSPSGWVRDQVEAYERSGGTEANTLGDTALPVVIVTMRGNKSGKVRKVALMRVEHDGEYALVASKGGAPSHPVWYYNLKEAPDEVLLQDGPEPFPSAPGRSPGPSATRGGSGPSPPTRRTRSTRSAPRARSPSWWTPAADADRARLQAGEVRAVGLDRRTG